MLLTEELFDKLKNIELTNEINEELKLVLIQLKSIYSDFIKLNTYNDDSFSNIHKQLSLLNQKVVGLLEDNLSFLEGQTLQLKQPTIKEEIIQLVLNDLN